MVSRRIDRRGTDEPPSLEIGFDLQGFEAHIPTCRASGNLRLPAGTRGPGRGSSTSSASARGTGRPDRLASLRRSRSRAVLTGESACPAAAVLAGTSRLAREAGLRDRIAGERDAAGIADERIARLLGADTGRRAPFEVVAHPTGAAIARGIARRRAIVARRRRGWRRGRRRGSVGPGLRDSGALLLGRVQTLFSPPACVLLLEVLDVLDADERGAREAERGGGERESGDGRAVPHGSSVARLPERSKVVGERSAPERRGP